MRLGTREISRGRLLEYAVCFLFLLLFCIFTVTDGINTMQYNPLLYDEAYNATVAANVARYGEYRVSYPYSITFYNIITTGVPVLLPTAAVFTLFGISTVTAAIVPLLYSALSIFGMWVLLCAVFPKKRGFCLIAAALSVLVVLADSYYAYISVRLLGEIASIFFLIVSCIFLYVYFSKGSWWAILLSGVLVAFSFLTKSATIFFVVSFSGVVLLETIFMRTIKWKHCLFFFLGMALGVVLLDSYKLMQLGGVHNYLAWWLAEMHNMLNQSSGVDLKASIMDKINYLPSVFYSCKEYVCVILVLLPVVLYAVRFFAKLAHKEILVSPGMNTMLFIGIGGASLLVYFVLLGGSGLMYARRLEVNAVCIRLFAAYAVGLGISQIRHFWAEHGDRLQKNIAKIAALSVVLVFFLCNVFPLPALQYNTEEYIRKDTRESYSLQLMNQHLQEVGALETDAVLYCVGWWQEPNISLFLDREIRDSVLGIPPEDLLNKTNYLVTGHYMDGTSITDMEEYLNVRLIRIDTSDVDYSRYTTHFDRKDFDLFAIYRIEPRDIPTP